MFSFRSKLTHFLFCLLIKVAKVVFKQNYGALILSMACVAMGIHADVIRNTFDGCPVSMI